jgi:integrase
MTPSEVVEAYRRDVRADLYEGMAKWERIFDGFASHLKGLGLSPSTVSLYHLGARMLINRNVPRSLRLMASPPPRHSRVIPPPSKNQLMKVWAKLDTRGRCIVGVLKDSGISASDAIRLRIGDLEGYLEGEEYCHVRLVRVKEHVAYDTFLGPDATLSLREWLGESASPETPVFGQAREKGAPMSLQALRLYFLRLSREAQVALSTHRLRKYFATYMAMEVRHPVILKYWMGHRVARGDVEARYVIPPLPEQMELYKKAYPAIRLGQEEKGIEKKFTAVPS